MNIIDAIKSGKRFKRDPYEFSRIEHWVGEDGYILITQNEILADDWELESEKIELTWNAVSRAIGLSSEISHDNLGAEKAYIKEQLGFKD